MNAGSDPQFVMRVSIRGSLLRKVMPNSFGIKLANGFGNVFVRDEPVTIESEIIIATKHDSNAAAVSGHPHLYGKTDVLG